MKIHKKTWLLLFIFFLLICLCSYFFFIKKEIYRINVNEYKNGNIPINFQQKALNSIEKIGLKDEITKSNKLEIHLSLTPYERLHLINTEIFKSHELTLENLSDLIKNGDYVPINDKLLE